MAIKAKKIQPAKTEAIDALKTMINESKDFVFTDYRGLTVEQISNLRKQLRVKNAELHVVKNNFARIAFDELNFPDVHTMLEGPTAVAFAKQDSNEIAKIISDFAKESPIKLKGGLVEKNFYDSKQMDSYSKLPGKNQLISMLMSTMNAPLQNFVYVLNAVPTKLVRTLQAIADKKAGE